MPRIPGVSRRTLAVAALVGAAACGADRVTADGDGTGSQLVLASDLDALTIGASQRLSARVVVAGGDTTEATDVVWSTTDPAIAAVSDGNLLTAVGAGDADLVAERRGVRARWPVHVGRARVASVVVTLDAPSIAVGQQMTARVVLRDSRGNVLTGRTVSWSSSNAAVATVGSTGAVTAMSVGTAAIRATSEGEFGEATVTVSPVSVASVTIAPASLSLVAGETGALAATCRDANGTALVGRAITWSSDAPAVATVDAAGLVRGVAPGSGIVTAACEGRTATAPVAVSAAPVATVSVSPATATLGAGGTTQLTATARDASGNVVAQPVTWSSSSAAVATVSSTGLVSGVASGSATITATASGRTGTATITVTAPPTGSVSCANAPSAWIWCDDFEQDRLSRYFEVNTAGGGFARTAGVGRNGSSGMRARFAAGQVEAGNLKLAFGRTPSTYFRPVDAGTANYREVYWRVWLRHEASWQGGGGYKFSRATVFAGGSWQQAMIAHVWSGGDGTTGANHLFLDPASGTDVSGVLRTTTYNDFPNLRWLGGRGTTTPLFAPDRVGAWYCIETHVRLNDAGQSNGVFEMWIDGVREAGRTDLDWLGGYDAYGINAVFLENYWNTGSPRIQERYFDEFVVSTQRIGC